MDNFNNLVTCVQDGQGHWKLHSELLMCHFLLVINCTRGCILYCLWNTAFDRGAIASLYFATPVVSNAPMNGFPQHDLRKILHGSQMVAKVHSCEEIFHWDLEGAEVTW